MHISDCTTPLTFWYSKLDPLATHIQTVSKSICTPSSNVSIDEMIARFSGRSAHTVRIKNKPTFEGFKILSLCESGYTYTFLPTSRISPSDVPKLNDLNQIRCLVHHLITQLPYYWFLFNVHIDNYFSNVSLFQNFQQIDIVAFPLRQSSEG